MSNSETGSGVRSGSHAEVANGQRFCFGRNWMRFLKGINAERIALAEQSLREMLGVQTLEGLSFVDVGSGSGVFSLAARQLGAKVQSFDYDPDCVECTRSLRRQFLEDDTDWIVEEGSVLDESYLSSIGKFDVVYSWGVLHHTGALMTAMERVSGLVTDGGMLFIAIYNDQGAWSRRWLRLKHLYNELPSPLRLPYTVAVMGAREIRAFAGALLRLKPAAYLRSWTQYASISGRGMSRWRDMVDWMGGYPFEVAKPEEVFRFYRDRDFELVELTTCAGGLGCNQYVFRKR